jgi:hypothetical protein
MSAAPARKQRWPLDQNPTYKKRTNRRSDPPFFIRGRLKIYLLSAFEFLLPLLEPVFVTESSAETFS